MIFFHKKMIFILALLMFCSPVCANDELKEKKNINKGDRLKLSQGCSFGGLCLLGLALSHAKSTMNRGGKLKRAVNDCFSILLFISGVKYLTEGIKGLKYELVQWRVGKPKIILSKKGKLSYYFPTQN